MCLISYAVFDTIHSVCHSVQYLVLCTDRTQTHFPSLDRPVYECIVCNSITFLPKRVQNQFLRVCTSESLGITGLCFICAHVSLHSVTEEQQHSHPRQVGLLESPPPAHTNTNNAPEHSHTPAPRHREDAAKTLTPKFYKLTEPLASSRHTKDTPTQPHFITPTKSSRTAITHIIGVRLSSTLNLTPFQHDAARIQAKNSEHLQQRTREKPSTIDRRCRCRLVVVVVFELIIITCLTGSRRHCPSSPSCTAARTSHAQRCMIHAMHGKES